MVNNVVVIGSYNLDFIINSEKIPAPGETVIGDDCRNFHGGKGANQAVAAARAGASVTFIGKCGDDIYGLTARENLKQENINLDYFTIDHETTTGMAYVIVNQTGENSIVVIPGANGRLSPNDVKEAEDAFREADFILLQLEIPLDTVTAVIRQARITDVPVILNPAPYKHISESLLKDISIITPNIIEAEAQSGIKLTSKENYKDCFSYFHQAGVRDVLITMGNRGTWHGTKDYQYMYDAFPVKAVDSTGAGDVFNGVLAALLSAGYPLNEAIPRANAAAAISVTRPGAQNSSPSASEIEEFYQQWLPVENK